MVNWKTTVAGVLAILSAVFDVVMKLINGTPIDWNMAATAILAGIGLLTAKDHNVTGGTVNFLKK